MLELGMMRRGWLIARGNHRRAGRHTTVFMQVRKTWNKKKIQNTLEINYTVSRLLAARGVN